MEDRDFKGVWIPKEIWLDESLSVVEKCLIAEIDSLSKGRKGCFASNEYLGKFIGVSAGRCANIICDLRKRGHIKTSFFDGKNRGVKVCLNSKKPSRKREPMLHENVNDASRKREPMLHENVNIYNTVINTIDTTNVVLEEERKINPLVQREREKAAFQKLQMETDFFVTAFEDQIWLDAVGMRLENVNPVKAKFLFSCFYDYKKLEGRKYESLMELKGNFINWAKPTQVIEKLKEFKPATETNTIIEKWINLNYEDFKKMCAGFEDEYLSQKVGEFISSKYQSVDLAIFCRRPIQVFKKEFTQFIVESSKNSLKNEINIQVAI